MTANDIFSLTIAVLMGVMLIYSIIVSTYSEEKLCKKEKN